MKDIFWLTEDFDAARGDEDAAVAMIITLCLPKTTTFTFIQKLADQKCSL